MRRTLFSAAPLLLLALALLLPSIASAGFNQRKPAEVGVVFMPFEAAKAEDDALAFLLEDLVGAKLMRKIRHPVHTGRSVTVALSGTPATCLREADCVRLLGGQFNSSLVVAAIVSRTGSEVRIATEWYTTGNGYKVSRESATFPVGEEELMLDALAGWFKELFDASLLVTPDSGASEGTVIGGADDEGRAEELRRGKEKRVSARREDFGSSRPDDSELRGDPTDDLRAAVTEDEDDYDDEPPPRTTGRTSPRDEPDPVDVSDLDDEPEEIAEPVRTERKTPAAKKQRNPRREERSYDEPARDEPGDVDLDEPDDVDLDVEDEPDDDGLSLSADDDTGDSVSNYMDAQKLGISKREYNRMAKSGQPFEEFVARRWAHGGRFHLRVGGFYGFGGLTRRYSTTIFIRAGNSKTEESAWESLGPSAVNPGGSIGFGFAPIDLLEIGVDVGVMYAKQDLRREYDGHETGSNIPAVPASAPTAHIVLDVAARLLLNSKGKVKIAPKLGGTFLFMAGYDIVSEPPLEYTDRPPAVVVGVTLGLGALVSLTPFVGLDFDLSGTVYVTQGAANHTAYDYFGGVTEPYLNQDLLQPRLPAVPVMGRFTVGPRFFF